MQSFVIPPAVPVFPLAITLCLDCVTKYRVCATVIHSVRSCANLDDDHEDMIYSIACD